jgi:hypothetical protein
MERENVILSGIKFGVGIWLATIAVIAFAMSLGSLVSHIRSYFRKKRWHRDSSELRRTAHGYLLWTRGPESARHDDGSCRSFSFRTTIRWRGRENPNGSRKEPHYHY